VVRGQVVCVCFLYLQVVGEYFMEPGFKMLVGEFLCDVVDV
jgi:hypothetical protein